jgi:ABC-type lipoprotein export system ATPase subunit
MTALLTLTHVEKRYGGGAGPEVVVLKDINLSIGPGETVAILGPSGSGKSTLLSIAGALDRPTSGSVLFDGKSLSTLDEVSLARLRNADIGFVFQMHHLLPQCTVMENVLVPTLVHPEAGDVHLRARQLLERMGLGHRFEHRPGHLSGGERQRTAIVRALINRPKLLLADEPTGALDRESAERLAELLGELNKTESISMILATHSPQLAEKMQSHYVIKDGRLEPAASPS